MKQLIAQRQEQRADIYKVEREDETAFTINGHQYRLVANYRDAFEPDKLGERFSTILSKYDYIVGDWGFEQLRLKGFYASSNKNAQKKHKWKMQFKIIYMSIVTLGVLILWCKIWMCEFKKK